MFIGITQQQSFYGAGDESGGSLLTITSFIVTQDSNSLTASYTFGGGATPKEQLPVAKSVDISGLLFVDEELVGNYTYSHINNAAEGTTLFRWYTADDINGTNETQVATTQNYTLQASDEGKYIKFDVIPYAGATAGNTFSTGYYSEPIGTSLEEIVVLISFGSSTKPTLTDSRTWNNAYTDDPTTSYALNDLSDSDGNTITGLNINVDLTMSDATPGAGGFASAFDAGDGIAWPANWSVSYWYSTGTRGFQLEIPAALQGAPFEIILSGSENSGTNELIASVNGIQKTIANATNNSTQYLRWSYDDLVGASDFGQIQVRLIDGTGIGPLGVMEVHYKVPS